MALPNGAEGEGVETAVVPEDYESKLQNGDFVLGEYGAEEAGRISFGRS